jgi:uncharacterized protein YjiS (DUF1127 family)
MKKIYLMTAVAAIVVVAVMSQMRAAEALNPEGPSLRQRLYAAAARLSRRLRRIVNNRIAAMIAYRAHQATLSALGNLSDPELKDFGVYRGSPGSAFHRHRDVKFPSTRRGRPR